MKKTLLPLLLIFGVFSSKAATFTSIASGNYSATSTWSVVGSDPDGIPDSNDDVFIAATHTITLTASASAKSVTINPSGSINLNNKVISTYGSFTNNGTVTTNGGMQFMAAGTISGNAISLTGGVTFYTSYTIASGFTLSCSGLLNVSNGYTITNNGTVNANNTATCLRLFSSAVWINAAGSNLRVRGLINNAGTINASANSNTVTFQTNTSTTVNGTNATYYNLTLSSTSASTKTVSGSLTVLNNLTIGSFVTLNCNNNNITVGGNWANNANTNCTNMATVTFNGSGTQSITRSGTEQFKNVTLSGTGIVSLGNAVICTGNLTINSGTLDVTASNFNLTVAGNFTITGTFNARSGLVTLNGTSAQTIGGSSATSFYNITSTNTVSVAVTIAATISNVLTVSSGSFGPSGAGSITIPATAATTYGRIGVVGGTLTGSSWIIKSYINGPATAYWQYLSTPINGNTIADWDGDTRFYMSGVNGNDGNACCPTFYSVRTYNTTTNTYSNVTSTGTSLVKGRGYMVWMGDNMTSLTAPLVYDSRGIPNFGTVTRSVTAGGSGGGYNLVGNPYACPITYSSVQAASGNIGASFFIMQENGSYATNPNGGVIAPNQGFMCVASSTGNMTFTEACKNTSTNPNIIRQAEERNYVRINITNDQNGLGGETAIQFTSDAHDGYDVMYDLPFLANVYETASNIWSTDKDGKDNLLNALDANEASIDIPLAVSAAVAGTQTISFRGINTVYDYSCAWLQDEENGTRINLRDQDNYSFDAEAGSVHHFVLHFDRSGKDCPLSQQNLVNSLDAMTQVYVNSDNLMANFYFTENTDVQITIYDADGREVSGPKQYTVSSGPVALDNPGAHGIYFVQIVEKDHVCTKKIYY